MGQYFQAVAVDLKTLEQRVAQRDPALVERMQAPTVSYSARLLGAAQTRQALDELLAGAISRELDGDYYALAVIALAFELGTRTGAPDVTFADLQRVKGFDVLYPYADANLWPLGIPRSNFVLGATYDAGRCQEVLGLLQQAYPREPSAAEAESSNVAVFAAFRWLRTAVAADQTLLLCHM